MNISILSTYSILSCILHLIYTDFINDLLFCLFYLFYFIFAFNMYQCLSTFFYLIIFNLLHFLSTFFYFGYLLYYFCHLILENSKHKFQQRCWISHASTRIHTCCNIRLTLFEYRSRHSHVILLFPYCCIDQRRMKRISITWRCRHGEMLASAFQI